MTAVDEAGQCATQRDLGRGGSATLPFGDLFGKGVARGIDLNDEFTPGQDVLNDLKCGRTLPDGDGTWCGQPPPWTSLDWPGMVAAFDATRIRRVTVSTAPEDGSAGAAPGRTVGYVEIQPRLGDPRGVAAFLELAFSSCAGAAPGSVGGIKVMAGSVPSSRSSNGEALAVAFLARTRFAWVILDGRDWTKAARDRALNAIAAHLR